MADEPPKQEVSPDLATLLQSLAGFARQQQDAKSTQQITEAAPYENQQAQNNEAVQANYSTVAPHQPYPVVPQQLPQQYPAQQQYPGSQYQYGYPADNFGPSQQISQNQLSAEPSRKVVDPATIIDWPSGLKCVMRTVARHDQMILEIRRMIKTQREHEEHWWSGRQALIEKQANRKEGREKLAAVLRSVGSTAAEDHTSDSDTAAEVAEELRIFDTKVYKAQHQMVKEMSTKLKSMGVPFFGTRSELVRVSSTTDGTVNKPEVSRLNLDGPSEKKQDGGKIDEEDLVNLQRKMLQILEDLCEG